MKESITFADIRGFAGDFAADPANHVAQNIVTANGVKVSAKRYSALREDVAVYSVNLEQHGITNQKSAGRCWAYAGFNVLRDKIIKELNLDNFTFSGNYIVFYDKLEKANLFLEGVLEFIDLPLNSREMERLGRLGTGDGGEWEMFVSLVQKYGVVPQNAQPETFSSDASREMNSVLRERLLGFARDMRRDYAAGKSVEEIRAGKAEMLSVIYRILAICMGEPVKKFDFKVRTKDGRYIADNGITPKEFYDKYIGVDLTQYISLLSGSSEGAELKKYAVDTRFNGDVIEGKTIDYVSVPVETLKQVAIEQLKGGEPIWFGCEVGTSSERKSGIMDENLYDLEGLFNTKFDMTKPDRFAYGLAHLSHAMTLKGVDLTEDGVPIRWRVENSWGDEAGERGMFLMTDGWFTKFNYQIIANRKYVPQEILDVYDNTDAEVLPFWSPRV